MPQSPRTDCTVRVFNPDKRNHQLSSGSILWKIVGDVFQLIVISYKSLAPEDCEGQIVVVIVSLIIIIQIFLNITNSKLEMQNKTSSSEKIF